VEFVSGPKLAELVAIVSESRMTWPEGRTAIEYLITKGWLERIDRGTVEATAQAILERSERRLATARGAQEDRDPEGSYSNAYTAYRMAAEALLARQALRSTGGEGGHKHVEEAVAAQFRVEIPAFAQPTFERFRGTRHTVEYFDPGRPPVIAADAEWALGKAQDALNGARTLLASGRLVEFV
jgi:hypothetical protein